jgi:hypothetical protein
MFTLTINTDNAAFEGDNRNYEVASILDTVVAKLNDGETSGVCRDANGNKVGEWKLEED